MSDMGFSRVKTAIDDFSDILRDLATLIGEPKDTPVELHTGLKIVPGLGLNSDARNLMARAHDIDQGIFNILVIGEFNNGKSTLLNALIGDKLMPAKAVPTTAIITKLVYGTDNIVAVYGIGDNKPRNYTWEEFKAEFTLGKEDQQRARNEGKLPDRFQNIDHALFKRDHTFLSYGVKFVDSPGLQDHENRNRVTRDFARQSQAIILVLNATQQLTMPEREFIEEALRGGSPNHVFFVINRINEIDEEDREDVVEFFKEGLKPHFLDEHGRFDSEFYHRRVFYVNAKAALDARTASPEKRELLEESGILPFEEELERFLTGEEKLHAALQSTLTSMYYSVTNARERAKLEKRSLDQPLAELRNLQARIEQELQAAESEKKALEQQIVLKGHDIKRMVYDSLINYIGEMQRGWPEESQTLDFGQSENLLQILKRPFQKKQFQEKITRTVDEYIKNRLTVWAEDRLPRELADELDQFQNELELQVGNVDLRLSQSEAAFAGEAVLSEFEPEATRNQGRRMIQAAVGILMYDPSQVGAALLGNSSWMGIVGRAVLDGVVFGVLMAVLGPLGVPAYIAVEIVHVLLMRDKHQERLREDIGTKLFEKLEKDLPTKREDVYKPVEKRFAELASQVAQRLQDRIDELRAEMKRVIKQKGDKAFSIENEKKRLDTIGQVVLDLYNRASEIGGQETYDPVEFDSEMTIKADLAAGD